MRVEIDRRMELEKVRQETEKMKLELQQYKFDLLSSESGWRVPWSLVLCCVLLIYV